MVQTKCLSHCNRTFDTSSLMITIYGPDVFKNELELFQWFSKYPWLMYIYNKIIIDIYRDFYNFVIETLTYIYEVGKTIRVLEGLFDHSYKE